MGGFWLPSSVVERLVCPFEACAHVGNRASPNELVVGRWRSGVRKVCAGFRPPSLMLANAAIIDAKRMPPSLVMGPPTPYWSASREIPAGLRIVPDCRRGHLPLAKTTLLPPTTRTRPPFYYRPFLREDSFPQLPEAPLVAHLCSASTLWPLERQPDHQVRSSLSAPRRHS